MRALRWVLLFAVMVMFAACGGATTSPPGLVPLANDTPTAERTPPPDLVQASAAPPAAEPEPGPAAADSPGAAPVSAAAKSLASFPVFTDPGELPKLVIADPQKPATAVKEGAELPLRETRVVARLSGFVAEVEVTQKFKNPKGVPIEAVYVFPLPENAAVNKMKMVVGDRVVEAQIEERQKAKRIYDQAKKEGFTAALLEQERPNVFTQSVANIAPDKEIEVTVRYVQDLSFDAGVYEFVFPMVVGPRFTKGAADAARISPPYVGKGERSGHDISIEVVAQPGLAIGDYAAITHEVVTKKDGEGLLHLALSPKDKVPNRDFVLRYSVAGERPRASLLTSAAEGGFFALTIDPPTLDVEDLVGRREIVFVVDVSGSMRGVPLALCQQAMRQALSRLRPVDTFNVITFASGTGQLFETPRAANDAAIREAVAFIDRMRAGGGTHMLDAVSAALTPDVGEGRHRYVFFLTDGYVGVEDQILSGTRKFVKAMADKGQRARVFGFGVGSSPNRALLEGLSREGKGVAVYATNREDPGRAVNQFFRFIDRSVLRDVEIDWGGTQVSEIVPSTLPDLFASHPLVVHGKLKGAPGKVVVRASSAAGRIELPVTVVPEPKSSDRRVLGSLWARHKIGLLEGDLAAGDQRARAEITSLGLSFGLVTRFTSFVAVDRSTKTGDGRPERIHQPLDEPEGVDVDAAGGRRAEQLPSRPALGGSAGVDEGRVREEHEDDGQRVASAPPPASPSERGCFCESAAFSSAPGAGAWALAALAFVGALRARRRRR